MSTVEYATSSEAREHFKDILDAAAEGQPVIVRRDKSAVAAVLNAAKLQHFLATVVPAKAVVVPESDGYSVFLEDQPIGADGATLDGALAEMIEALRTYAQAWHDVLHSAVNHRDNWGLVQLIGLSTDAQLRDWLTGGH